MDPPRGLGVSSLYVWYQCGNTLFLYFSLTEGQVIRAQLGLSAAAGHGGFPLIVALLCQGSGGSRAMLPGMGLAGQQHRTS